MIEIVANSVKYAGRITVNPNILVGKPTIRGLRISVEHILKALAAGIPQEELLEDYPELEPEDFPAVLAYGAADGTDLSYVSGFANPETQLKALRAQLESYPQWGLGM